MANFIIVFLAILVVSAPLHAQSEHREVRLLEAIELVRSQGTEISYSSRLVKDWMRVSFPMTKADPLEALAEALSHHGLLLSEVSEGRFLIVKSPSAREDSSPDKESGETTLPPAPTIDEITVTASHHTMFERSGVPGQTLDGDEIKLLPHIGDDALRAMHKLPGVASTDFQAPFHLRGGYISETGVYLDGVQINDPYHMRSLFRPLSLIDPGIIGTAHLQSGGMTAEVGNFLSGVVDISSDRIETENTHEVGVSSITAFARTKGWFAGGRGDYLMSVRRGWLDLVADKIVGDGEVLSPRYSDAFLRASYEVSPSTELSLHALWSDDDVEYIDPGDGEERFEAGGSRYVWLNVDTRPRRSLRVRGTLISGRDENTDDGSQFRAQEEAITRLLMQSTDYVGASGELLLLPSERQMIKLGLQYRDISTRYNYQLNSWRRTSFVNGGSPFVVNRNTTLDADSAESSIYASYRLKPSERAILEGGVRWDRQESRGFRTDSQFSPRLNVLFRVGERTDVRAAWGVFFQPHLVTQLDIVDGFTEVYRPEKAVHTILGVSHRFRSGVQLSGDLYNKDYSHLRPRFENVVDTYEFAAESNFDRIQFRPTSGRAYGVELGLRSRKSEGLGWWLNYSWSRAYDVVDDREVPRAWEQRNLVTANLSWTGRTWSASAIARYHSGWPRTIVSVSPVFGPSGNIIGADADISDRNSGRYDEYTRVDIRVARQIDLSKGQLTFYVELFNVFDAENPCCTSNHTLNIDADVSLSPKIDDALPRFPSFGFVWKFGPGSYQDTY